MSPIRLRSCSSRLVSLAAASALLGGCVAADGEAGPDGSAAVGGKSDDPAAAEAPAEGLLALGRALEEVGVQLGEHEASLVAITANFPLGELELRDDDDLAEFTDGLDFLLNGLIADLPALLDPTTHEIAVPGATLCGAISLDDATRDRCVALADAADLRLAIAGSGGAFEVTVIHGADDDAPITFSVDTRGGIALDTTVSVPDLAGIFDLVDTITQLDLGALTSEVALQGTIEAHFRHDAEGVRFELGLPKALDFSAASARLHLESGAGGPLLRVTVEADGKAALDVDIGPADFRAPTGRFTDDATLGDLVTLDWGGVSVHAEGTPGAVRFEGTLQPFSVESDDDDDTTVILAADVLTRPVTGTVDAEGELRIPGPDLTGIAQTYDSGYDAIVTHMGLTARKTASPGATILDLKGSLRATNLFRLGLVVTHGELTKIDSFQCATAGTLQVAIEGGETLQVSEDANDSCVVGYYTRDDAGAPQYHYTTTF